MRARRSFGLNTQSLLASVLASLLPLAAAPLAGQMHHVARPQRVTRAVGVYEWTGDLAKPDASRLIPVSLFIEGHFEDAGVYLAQPVPLALETGNVYAIQRSGDLLGTLDLDFARDIVGRGASANEDPLGAWYGYGRFLPLEAEKAPPPLKPSAHPSAIVSSGGSTEDDDRPHFVYRSPQAGSDSGTSTSSSSTPAPPEDADRPRMNRRADTSSTTSNAPSSPGTADVPDNDPDRPTLRHRDDKADNGKKDKRREKESGSGVSPMGTSLNEDPDRPSLHRGKVESATAAPQLTGMPPNLHQAVAVSDAADREPHVFARDWESPAERSETVAAMQRLAQPLVSQYMDRNRLQAAAAPAAPHVTSPAPKPPTARSAVTRSTPAHRSTRTTRSAAAALPPAPSALAFGDEQIRGFTLSYGGLPTFVYSAAVQTAAGQPVRVTLVAQRLPSGELQTALSSVTDEAHLDRTPWIRLVDAVDSDASHRASLLFELRARSSRQFALYSLVSAHAEQSFVTGVIQ